MRVPGQSKLQEGRFDLSRQRVMNLQVQTAYDILEDQNIECAFPVFRKREEQSVDTMIVLVAAVKKLDEEGASAVIGSEPDHTFLPCGIAREESSVDSEMEDQARKCVPE